METKIYLIACHICDDVNGYDEDKIIRAFMNEADAKIYLEKLDDLVYLLQEHRDGVMRRQQVKRPIYKGIGNLAKDISLVKIETVILTT